jgi:hypothetical protein
LAPVVPLLAIRESLSKVPSRSRLDAMLVVPREIACGSPTGEVIIAGTANPMDGTGGCRPVAVRPALHPRLTREETVIMSGKRPNASVPRPYAPAMTEDYSRISETARAVDRFVLPRVLSYLDSIGDEIAQWPAGEPFVIVDYGAADGANSSRCFGEIADRLHAVNPSLRIRFVYVDIADSAPFERFRAAWDRAARDRVEAEYIQRSFYETVPELAGSVRIGYSSTALHWLDTRTAGPAFFRHPEAIQPNQMTGSERGRFAEKWARDWHVFFAERASEVADGGRLFLAALADLGGDRWPASAGYDRLRDVCRSLHEEGRITADELDAVFIPDYFATPEEMHAVLGGDAVAAHFSTESFEATTVPCAYFAETSDGDERRRLARALARVVRAWSESSIRVGLSADRADLVDECYRRLEDAFFDAPQGLPYQYCLVELERRGAGRSRDRRDEAPGPWPKR